MCTAIELDPGEKYKVSIGVSFYKGTTTALTRAPPSSFS